MSEYKKQAEKFLKDTETSLKVEFKRHGVHFEGETEKRDIYEITLSKGNRDYKFDFGQSIANSGKYKVFGLGNGFISSLGKKDFIKAFEGGQRMFNEVPKTLLKNRDYIENKEFSEPSAYDVLACLDIFEDDFEEFCACFGYEEDSIKALKIFEKVEEQNKQLKIIWSSSDIEKLQEIQ